jgi:hypothetical protein
MEAPTTATWNWTRQDDGSYVTDSGWRIEKWHAKGSQPKPFMRSTSKASDFYTIFRPNGQRITATATTLKDAKLSAERRNWFDKNPSE